MVQVHVKRIHHSICVVYHIGKFRICVFRASGLTIKPREPAWQTDEVSVPKSSKFVHAGSGSRTSRSGPARRRSFQATGTRGASNSGTLAERVYQQLKRDIIRGVFQPGEAINEKVLARKYRGSRTPVRESVMRLQQESLLRLVPNKGYFVSHLTIHELNEMYEYRAELEGFTAELAARRWSDQSLLDRLAALAHIQHRTDDRASYERFIEADTEFHLGIAQLTRNRLVLRAVSEVRCHMERIMYAAIDIGYYGEVPTREHTDILEAVRRRDAHAARQCMYDHIVGSKDKVLQLAIGRSSSER
jgi:DNA-binding GntR family transcriptional regulator